MGEIKSESNAFYIKIDAEELRSIYNRYGQATLEAAVDKITNELKVKIKSALKLSEQTGSLKPLVEVVK